MESWKRCDTIYGMLKSMLAALHTLMNSCRGYTGPVSDGRAIEYDIVVI